MDNNNYNDYTKEDLIKIIYDLENLLAIERNEHRDIYNIMKKHNEELINLLNIEKRNGNI